MKLVYNLSLYSGSSILILFFHIRKMFCKWSLPFHISKNIVCNLLVPFQALVHSHNLLYFFVLKTFTEEYRLHVHYDLISLLRPELMCSMITPCVVGWIRSRLLSLWR
jgi:hypothetical protein